MTPALIIPVGIPGSGKSTFTQSLVDYHDAVVISPDALKYENGVYVFSPARNAQTWATAYTLLGMWLRTVERATGTAPETVVFDATNLDPKMRAPLIHISKAFRVRVEGVYLNTPYEECVARNDKRSPDRKVPMKVMERMHKSLVPPSEAEGFDAVTVRTFV